jgi:hypothetical protein
MSSYATGKTQLPLVFDLKGQVQRSRNKLNLTEITKATGGEAQVAVSLACCRLFPANTNLVAICQQNNIYAPSPAGYRSFLAKY